MSEEISTLFTLMKQELEKQATTITDAVTAKITQTIDEKIRPLAEENKTLRLEIENLNIKINNLENADRKNNIIIHGIEETENNYEELFNTAMEVMRKINVKIASYDLNKMYRIGKPDTGKTRAILISFTTFNKKIEVLQNKNKMPASTYITEDFSKETLGKRKELQKQLKEERAKGNDAFIKNNKIIIKEKTGSEKRKWVSASPTSMAQSSGEKTIIAPAKLHRTDPFAQMRARSNSNPNTKNPGHNA